MQPPWQTQWRDKMKETTKELFREIAFKALEARLKVELTLTDNDEHSTAFVVKRDNNTQALKLTCSPLEDDDKGESIIIDDLLQDADDEGEDCEEDEPLNSAQNEYTEDDE